MGRGGAEGEGMRRGGEREEAEGGAAIGAGRWAMVGLVGAGRG